MEVLPLHDNSTGNPTCKFGAKRCCNDILVLKFSIIPTHMKKPKAVTSTRHTKYITSMARYSLLLPGIWIFNSITATVVERLGILNLLSLWP